MKKLILLLTLFIGIGLAAQAETTAIEDAFDDPTKTTEEIADVQVNFLNGVLTVENAPLNSSVEIFSMLGVSVFRATVFEQPEQQFLLDLKKGFYIVKVGKMTKKISVK